MCKFLRIRGHVTAPVHADYAEENELLGIRTGPKDEPKQIEKRTEESPTTLFPSWPDTQPPPFHIYKPARPSPFPNRLSPRPKPDLRTASGHPCSRAAEVSTHAAPCGHGGRGARGVRPGDPRRRRGRRHVRRRRRHQGTARHPFTSRRRRIRFVDQTLAAVLTPSPRVFSCRSSTRWSAGSRRWRRRPPRSARCRPRSPRRCKVRNPFPPVCASFPVLVIRDLHLK